jgi:hypothetical protein
MLSLIIFSGINLERVMGPRLTGTTNLGSICIFQESILYSSLFSKNATVGSCANNLKQHKKAIVKKENFSIIQY